MKKLLALAAALPLMISLSGFAQSGSTNGVVVKGKVVDDKGKLVEKATVESFTMSNVQRRAPEIGAGKPVPCTNGTFEVTVEGDGAIIMATAPGFAWSWQNASSHMSSEIDLVLAPPAQLAGEVVDSAGKPCADAEVFVALAFTARQDGQQGGNQLVMGDAAKGKFKARSDAAGRFSITGFPEKASAALGATLAGKSLQSEDTELRSDSLPYASGSKDIRLVLEDAGSIEGKIIYPENVTAQPIARLGLIAESSRSLRILLNNNPANSRPDGSFSIPDVGPGAYQLVAQFDPEEKGKRAELAPVAIPVTVESGKTTKDLKLEPTRGGLIEVSVLSKDKREPVAGVSVQAGHQFYVARDVTGSDGKAFLRLPPGNYPILALKSGMPSANVGATTTEGATNQVEIEIASPRVLRGIVRGPDGKPAPDLQIQLVGGYIRSAASPKTADDGSFEIPVQNESFGSQPGRPCVFVRDTKNNLAAAADIEEDTEKVELQLVPGVTIIGRAECEGAPVTNATATLVFWSGNMGRHMEGMESPAKEAGTFEIKALPPGRKYGIYVSGKGYGQKYVDLGTGAEVDNKIDASVVEVKKANLKLAGQVVDADEKPVANVSIHISGDSQPNKNVQSDKEGKFSLEGVCEGAIRLYASGRNSYGNVTAEGGDTNVVIKLGEVSNNYSASAVATKLAGIVKGPDGTPAADVQINIYPSSGSSSKRTGTNGAFNLTWRIESWQMEQGGDAWLVARDSKNNLASAITVNEESTNIVLELKQGMTLKGKVLAADDKPLTKPEVGLWIYGGRTYENIDSGAIKVDGQGQFEIKNLPQGPKYIVYASAKDYGRTQVDVEHDDDSKVIDLAEFKLNPANMIIAGQVLQPDEKPASGVQISMSGDNQPQASTTTDKQGMFKLKVCEGKLRLYASGQESYANAEVEAGDTNVVLTLRSYNSVARTETPRRASLTGKPLPDLAAFGLASDTLPAGKPLLVCLLDAEQRPSRRSARLLSEQQDKLKGKGVGIVAIQTAAVSDETMKSWTNAAPLAYPIGCIREKSKENRWATDVQSLPWLILRDAKGNVAAEGFSMEELDAKLDALGK